MEAKAGLFSCGNSFIGKCLSSGRKGGRQENSLVEHWLETDPSEKFQVLNVHSFKNVVALLFSIHVILQRQKDMDTYD